MYVFIGVSQLICGLKIAVNICLQFDALTRALREDIEEARERRDETHRTAGVVPDPLAIREEARWWQAVQQPQTTQQFRTRPDR